MKREKNPGEKNKYDVIRHILKDYASRENPITRKEIEDTAKKMGCHIGRNAIENFMNEMLVKDYETEEECDKYLEAWKAEEREIIFCKKSQEGRRTKGYWMLESISDSEWMYLLDSVLYSKVMTKKEADNLAKRITLLAGKDFSELTGYRHKMYGQPFSHGNEKTENIGQIESLVLKQVYLIRKAILKRKKIRFTLNVYKYVDKEVKLVPCGKISRICSPLDVIYSNGRYYMLGADSKTAKSKVLKYKLYRIDLMTDLSVTKAAAVTKEEVGIEQEMEDLFRYRIENPYLFTGNTEMVRLRVNSEQFTQIVDWFGDNFSVIGHDVNEDKYYDIEVRVNTGGFLYWVLQYSGCVQVLDRDEKEENSFKNRVVENLKNILSKYNENKN